MVRVESLWSSLAQAQQKTAGGVGGDVTGSARAISRSVLGLHGAGEELEALVESTQPILGESANTTATLLLRYSWDARALIEVSVT
jgi:hypothetical protein